MTASSVERGTAPPPRHDPVEILEDVFGIGLQQFQRDWLTELFDEVDGRRRFTRALLGLPRGNGKSHLAAGIAGYMLVADKPRDGRPPQVVLAAGSWQQGMITFKRLREFIESNPELVVDVDVLSGRGFMRFVGGAELFVVSAEGPLQHGLEPTCVIFDEVWNQRKPDLYDALLGGMVKRPEPIMVMISTAGYDQDSLLAELCREGRQEENPRYFYRWHTVPDDADWTDRDIWREANPAMSCDQPFLDPSALEDSFSSMHENEFRRWHLNQWTASEASWITAPAWDQCDGKPQLDHVTPTILGIDASIRRDATAVVTVQKHGDIYHATFKVWEPGPKQDIPLTEVMDHIREQARDFQIVGAVYDPQFMHHAAQVLEDEGIPMIEWRQDNAHMVPASATVHAAVVNGKLRHGGHPIARAHALSAAVAETERGLRIKKTASRAPDDSTVALAMAVEWASRQQAERESIYERRGPVFV